MRQLLGLVCAGTLLSTAVPANADIVWGVDPVSRWVHSQPATCGFFRPSASYGVGAALRHDDDQIPNIGASEWVRYGPHGAYSGTVRIRALYDPVHRIANYDEFGTDIGNFGVGATASAPPPGTTATRDLSAAVLGGKVHLGDTLAQVASAFGLKGLQPVASGTCHAYRTVGFCSWKRAECACPPSPPYTADKRFGMVVFREGRVVAFAWDDGACGFG